MRQALGELAHALGTSLCLLRYREQARFIATGRAEHCGRARAAALQGTG